jgi:hypothetical protein
MRTAVAVIVFMQAVSRLSLLVLVALVAGMSVTGCVIEGHEDPTKLAALKKEPLATMKLPGGRLVLQSEIEADPHPALYPSKPSVASLTRVFAYTDPERARRGRVAAVAAAQAGGWNLKPEREDESPIWGRKRLATGGITLIIGWYEDKNEGVHKVSITLEHRPCALC